MKLFTYELKKIFKNKILLVLLVLLVLANVWLCLGEITDEKVAAEKQLSDFIEIYKADPEGMDKYIEEFNAAYLSARDNRDPVTGEWKYPDNVYTDNDYKFFGSGDFGTIKKLNEKYQAALVSARRVANGHITEYKYLGYTESDFEWQYQLKLLDSYDGLESLVFPSENVVGYDVFFDYSGFAALLLAALVLVGIMLIIPEKNGGMLLILRASKNGRTKTFLAKTAAGLVMSALLCALFTFSTLLTIYLKLGLYGADLPLQMVNKMMLSPFYLTIGQGVALVTAARVFSAFAFLTVVTLIAGFFADYIAPFAAGAIFVGANYAVGTYNFLNEYSALRNVNFFWSIDGTRYISTWAGVKFFGACAELMPLLIVLYLIVIVACVAGGAFMFARGALGRAKLKLPFVIGFIKKIHLPRLKFSTNIARYEAKKILTPLTAIVIALLVIATAYLSNGAYNVKRDYAQNLYTEYMTELEGEWTEEKHEALAKELSEISAIVAKHDAYSKAYEKGEITASEYGSYLNEYLTAQNKQATVTKLVTLSNKLKELNEAGVKTAFFDETGWSFLQKVNLSYILCAVLIIIFADVFSYEYRSGFYMIQRSEKNGRRKTLFIKLGIVAAFAAILGIAFEASQYVYAAHFSGLNGGAYTAISMGATENTEISVAALFLLRSARNVLYYVLLALGVAGISRGFKRILASLAIPTVIVFGPTIMGYFGINVFDKVNLLNIFVR